MSFPRYPAYKDSGVEWLGEVPEHWGVERFKLSVESCVNGVWGVEPGKGENDVTCIRVADFDRLKLVAADPDEPTIRSVNARDIEQRSLCNGVLLIEKSGGGEKQPVGAVVLYTGSTPAVCSNFVARIRLAQGMNSSFWRYAHHAAYSLKVNTKSIKQTSGIQNLDQQQYLDERAPFPPGDEQVAIATFLDRETAKIDALIAEQQRLIELLQEKRQAVISQAVTKGLNPAAPMQDSGVEWLGEVPEHWAKVRLRTLFRQEKRQDQPVHQVLSVYRDFGVIPKDSRDDNFNKTPENLSLYQLVNQNDLVINKMKAWQGSLGISPFIGITSPDYIVFTSRHHEFPGYLHFLLRSSAMVSVYRSISNGIRPAQWRIEPTNFLDLPVFLPPFEEQQHIASRINNECSNLDALTSESETSIHLLQERRSALISAAVTGQIDVRGLAPDTSAA